jgi:tRNA-specific 2-thiouridylase
MKHSTAVAVSGGIDSLTAAYLLKKDGHHVIGVHFLTGFEHQTPDGNEYPHRSNKQIPPLSAPKIRPEEIISYLDYKLGIEVKIIDCSSNFKTTVVDYFIQTYQTGQTPNPCMVCNPSIKFGSILTFARQLGATSLATGHYARIKKDEKGRFHLFKGVDPIKDQSYFLAGLNQQQLAGAIFPLGNKTKSEVKELAGEKGLAAITTEESQDVCFVKNGSYGDFIARQKGFESKPGLIEDVKGNIIGKHAGLHLFTIGQRRGINCPASEPYYVVAIDPDQNRLKVGFKKDLLSSECKVVNINWIDQKPEGPVKVLARVRYRHRETAATLFPTSEKTAIVRFEKPEAAVTPGQSAVFYRGDEVLGGGRISV